MPANETPPNLGPMTADRDPRAGFAHLGLLALGLVFLALAYSYPDCVDDDSHITYRYAANFAAGQGLVFNPGERVEGYTNFLWTLYLGVSLWLGANPILVSQATGIAAALLLVFVAYRLPVGAGRWGALLSAAAVATSPGLALEAVQGLETTTFALLVALTLACRLQEEEGTARLPWSGIAGGFAALCRPEGYLVFAVVEGVGLLCGKRGTLARRWPAWAFFALLTGPHIAFRLLYYGDLLPNTFYAKVGSSGSQFLRGLGYVGNYAIHHPGLGLLFGLGSFHLLRSQGAAFRPVMLIALPCVYLAYVASVGGDFKPTARFILPVLVPLAVVAAYGASGMTQRMRGAWWVAFALIALDLVLAYPPVAKGAHWRAMRYAQQQIAGETLAAHFPSDTTMALYNVGTIPWITGFHTIDMWGLTDRHIARRPMDHMGSGIAGHEKSDLLYVFRRRPDIHVPTLQFVTSKPVTLKPPPYFPPGFERLYVSRSIPAGDHWVNFFERRDLRF